MSTKTDTTTERTDTHPDRVGTGDGSSAPGSSKRTRRQVVISAVILALLAGASLIMLLTLTGGQELDASEVDVTILTQSEVSDALLRTVTGPDDLELELLYTPNWYFDWSGRPEPATDGSPTFAFFVFETSHTFDLPDEPPTMTIASESAVVGLDDAELISEAPHHRVWQLMFPADSAEGVGLLNDEEPLVVEAEWYEGTVTRMAWDQPLPFGLGALNTVETDTKFTMPALSFGAIAAIFGGALAALTPCMLLLAAYYTATLSATASIEAGKTTAERKLLITGLSFVIGFTAIYTAGGVIAGYIGESIGRFENIGSYARPISIAAGVVVILLGIRMASQARVPLVCKLPGFNRPAGSSWFSSAAMGATFAVGCLSCFSATVLTALLLYAGATGSPLAGGLVMLMFSAGVGVMFLIAALLVARAAPLTKWLHKAQPVIGAISAVIMIGLGVLMVTYKFHILTGYLFELWST